MDIRVDHIHHLVHTQNPCFGLHTQKLLYNFQGLPGFGTELRLTLHLSAKHVLLSVLPGDE